MKKATNEIRISVVIKTYDDTENSDRGHDYVVSEGTLKAILIETLDSLHRQTLLPYEILVVDLSRGREILRLLTWYSGLSSIKIRRVILKMEDFSHPRSINLGVREANGNIISHLSGDATPANERWLENLVKPLVEWENVAGAYSKQIKRPGMKVSAMERVRLWWRYGKDSTFRRKDPLLSAACCAFWKEIAKQIPFDEGLIELEDYDWGLKVKVKGLDIVYVGNSIVYHSHKLSNWKTFKRMVSFWIGRQRLRGRQLFSK